MPSQHQQHHNNNISADSNNSTTTNHNNNNDTNNTSRASSSSTTPTVTTTTKKTKKRTNLRELFSLRSELASRVEALRSACVIEKNLVHRITHRKKRSSGGNFQNVEEKHPSSSSSAQQQHQQQSQPQLSSTTITEASPLQDHAAHVSSSSLSVLENNSNNNNTSSQMKAKLFMAVLTEDPEYLHYLLCEGADPDSRDYRGRTPLHISCYTGNEVCVELLVEFGAQINLVDDKNQTPREVAVFHNHQTIAAFLDPGKVENFLNLASSSAGAAATAAEENENNNNNTNTTRMTELLSEASSVYHILSSTLPSSVAVARQSSEASMKSTNIIINNDSSSSTQPTSSSTPSPAATTSSSIIKSIWDQKNHPSVFRAVGDTESVVVCMVGLPGRGKSFLSKNCARFLRWKGVPTKVFNAGDYRRKILGVEGTRGANFFDKDNEKAKKQREEMAHMACADAAEFIKSQPVGVAFIDATNTNRTRRQWLLDFFSPDIVPTSRILFIESVCDDDEVVTQNILRDKVTNGDFDTVPVQQVVLDFHARIEKYREQYEPIDSEFDENLCFLKIINLKQTLIANRIQGRLQTLISSFITNLHPVAHSLYLVVPGPYNRSNTHHSNNNSIHQNNNNSQQSSFGAANNNSAVSLDDLVAAAQKQQQNNNNNNNNNSNTNNNNSLHRNASVTSLNSSTTNNGANVSTAASSAILPHIPSTVLSSSNVASNHELETLGHQVAQFVREKIDKTKNTLRTERKRFLDEEMKIQKSNSNLEADSEQHQDQEDSSASQHHHIEIPGIFDDHDGNRFLIAYAEDSSSQKTALSLKQRLEQYHIQEGWNIDPRLINDHTDEETSSSSSKSDDDQPENDEDLLDSEVVETTKMNKQENKDETRKKKKASKKEGEQEEHSVYVDIEMDTVQWLRAMSYGLCEGMAVDDAARDYPQTVLSAFKPHTGEPLEKNEVSGPEALELLKQKNNNEEGTTFENNGATTTNLTEKELTRTYVTGYPKGESLRQVAVRVSNMVMQWKRTDSPLLCICSVAPATLLVAFAADLPPECASQLRLPRNTIIEVTAKHALVLRSLLNNNNSNNI